MRELSRVLAVGVSLFLALGLAAGCATTGPGGGSMASTVHPEMWPEVDNPLPADPALEARVGEILAAMSTEEKVGQVLQPEIMDITPDQVREYHIGSVLVGGNGGPGGDEYAPAEEWLELADALWDASMDTRDGRHGIPVLWGVDAVHGHANVVGATIFPHNIGLGAAGNAELIRDIGEATAREMAATGIDWNFSPTVAVARDDRWGRTYESYSEDPRIVREYAAAMIDGLQGTPGTGEFLDENHVISTAKHFVGDGGTHKGVDQGDTRVSERELRDIHGQGYVAALETGVQTVMASYSGWNGFKLHGHHGLLTEVLKDRMGFDGFVIGDYNGHGQLPGCTNASCAAAFNAGVDMFMVPQDWKALYENTLKQVESGEITMERLDDAVRRILRVKMRAHMFDRAKPSERALGGHMDELGSAAHRAVARRAVRESLVLLKNDGGLLPLSPGARVLVAGSGADDVGKQSGGWTLTWQGTGNSPDHFPGATSIWRGIQEVVEGAGGTALLHAGGPMPSGDAPDVAIVVFGEDPYAEYEGQIDRLDDYRDASEADLRAVRDLSRAGIPVVSVFLSGRPLWVEPELEASDAFVAAWLPGSEGGGVADVLFRDADGGVHHDFTGRLSFSWPKGPKDTAVNYGEPGYDPLFPYGYGLSYEDSDASTARK